MGKLNTRWKTNTHFSRQILTYFRNKFLHFLSATFPLISNNKYSDFASALLTSEAKAHINTTHFYWILNIENKRLLFVSISSILYNKYNKYSHFASALHILGAKARIFHQHHLFHKQTLIFSILTTLTTKKLPKNYSKFKYSNIQILDLKYRPSFNIQIGHQISLFIR